MEEKEITERQFEQDRIDAMAARNEVYECSGTQVHTPDCDGECEVRVLADIEIEINNELKRWEELGMVPLGAMYQVPQIPGVPVDTLKVSVALAALTEMCYEFIDKEALNLKFQEMYLERIVAIRKANEEAMVDARRRSAIAVPGSQVGPQLIVPDNIRRKMN